MTKATRDNWLKEIDGFWRDSRGTRNIFTVIAFLAGLTIVLLPWVIVLTKYEHAAQLDPLVYANFFLVVCASLTDGVLSIVMENGFWRSKRRVPDFLNMQTGPNPTNTQGEGDCGPVPEQTQG